MSKSDSQQIATLYDQGDTYELIAYKVGYSRSAVQRAIQRAGIANRGRSWNRKHNPHSTRRAA